jgi:hypothetical protein
MTTNRIWSGVSIALGLVAGGLGCYGAWEFAKTLDGSTLSYIAVAAPVVAAAAALIPPLAEHFWKQGMRFKAVLWWLVLLPAAATVFYAAAERVYHAKSGAETERSALRNDSGRAPVELDAARAAELVASAEASKASGWKNKGSKYQGIVATHDAAKARLESAKLALIAAEKKATPESALKAPAWLMPLALDLIAFIAIWSGLTGPTPKAAVPSPARARNARGQFASTRPKRKGVVLEMVRGRAARN